MTIRHLKIFLAVAEYKTMSAAAEKLYISQPTVSQAIRELEEHYHGLLFERLGKKLYLTEMGKFCLLGQEIWCKSFRDWMILWWSRAKK